MLKLLEEQTSNEDFLDGFLPNWLRVPWTSSTG